MARRGVGALALSLAALMAVSAASFPADVTKRDRGADVKARGLTGNERSALDIVRLQATGLSRGVLVTATLRGGFDRAAGRGRLKRAVAALILTPRRGRRVRFVATTGPARRARMITNLPRRRPFAAVRRGRTLIFVATGINMRAFKRLEVRTFVSVRARRRRAASASGVKEELEKLRDPDAELPTADAVVLAVRGDVARGFEVSPRDPCPELQARVAEINQAIAFIVVAAAFVDLEPVKNQLKELVALLQEERTTLESEIRDRPCDPPDQTDGAPPGQTDGAPPGQADGDARLKDHFVPGGGANQIAPANSLYFTTDQVQPHRVGVVSAAGVGPQFNVPDPGGSPQGITFGPDGNAWFVESADDEVVRMTPAGVFTEFPIPAGSLGGPTDITAGPPADGKLWYVEQSGTRIVSITTDGATQEPFDLDPGSSPTSIVAGPDGRLWYTQFFDNEIGAITTAGVIQEFTVPTANSRPTGITVGPDNAIWFTEREGQKLGRIPTNAGSGADITEFPVPTGTNPDQITSGPDGRLWFTRRFGAVIGAMTTSGTLEQITLGTPTRGIASDAGKIWVAANDRIVEVRP